MKKITLHVPEELLARAQEETGAGISDTVRKGLQLLAASSSYDQLREMRGKLKVNLNLKDLREDREW